MVLRVVVRAVVLKAYKERESIPTLGPSLLNNLKVSWLKSERKGFGKIEKSRWCCGARNLQGEIESRLGRELFYVGFRVEETD